jgi:hypothetical protein
MPLVDYSGTKGAIEAMTFSLAQQLAEKEFASTRSRRRQSGRH